MTIDLNQYLALKELVEEFGPTADPDWLNKIAIYEAKSKNGSNGNNGHYSTTPPPPPPPPPSIVPPPPPPPNRPRAAISTKKNGERNKVEITEDFNDVAQRVLASWGERYTVFQNNGHLLELQNDPTQEIPMFAGTRVGPQMIIIRPQRVRTLASKTCTFFKGDKSDKALAPPDWLGNSVVVRNDYPGIPQLAGLVQAPTLRYDGALINERGYDPSTGLYLETDLQVVLPEHPTRDDARRALDRLMDLVIDFDFTKPAGRSVWVSALLSVTCRHTYKGSTPLFAFDANKPGSGKSRLGDMIGLIATGRPAPRMSYTGDEIEMDKRIISLCMSGAQFVFLDNLETKLSSSSLNAAITSSTYQARKLGVSETPILDMKIVWIATGNSIILGKDTVRRTFMARIEVECEHPELRTGPRPGMPWRYPMLLEHVERNRAELLGCALTIVSAYIRAGRPLGNIGGETGSFEEWSNTIRAAVIWAGGVDPRECLEDVRAADIENIAIRTMVECWPVADGVQITAASLLAWAEIVPPMTLDGSKRELFERTKTTREMWRNALLEWLPARGTAPLPTARDLGYALRSLKGAIIGDFKIDCLEPTKSGVPWVRIRVNGQPEPSPTAPRLITVG